MRASASGELVKVEIGQVLRRSSRLWKPARGSAASRGPSARLVGASLGVAAVLLGGQPLGAAAAPGPDPHPSATQPAARPAPDPAPPASRQSAPTPDSVDEVASSSSSAYEPAAQPSSPPSASVVRPRVTKPAPRPKTSAKPKKSAQAKPKAAAAKVPSLTARGEDGNETVRVGARSTAAAVSVAKSATDPMVLGAFALLTLVLSSAGLLLVLHRSVRSGARA